MSPSPVNLKPTRAQALFSSAFRIVISLIFLFAIMMFVNGYLGTSAGSGTFLIVAAMVGGYMALNIGANDVANNVGPAVGSGALTMFWAVILAAIFEVGGAMVAGGEVVGTIKKGIIDPAQIGDPSTFIWLMLAALLAGAVWLNIATYLGAPVSTTHSIVGGVLGAGIAAGGWQIADWDKMATIVASWVISPMLGGIIAALLLYLITRLIVDQKDHLGAAKRYLPWLMALMVWSFTTYMILKGLKKLWKFDFITAGSIGLAIAVLAFFLIKPLLARAAKSINLKAVEPQLEPSEIISDVASEEGGEEKENCGNLDSSEITNDGINSLFTIPLIFAAALLSFAHGANDVANAIGPLAAINDSLATGDIASKAAIPFWIMGVGALGIAVGLALYGPKLIRTVGSEITHLDKTRAFCVALAAAITVIIASQLGLPVSSTHIAVGGIFGVGFLREYLHANRARLCHEIGERIMGEDQSAVDQFLTDFRSAAFADQDNMIKRLKKSGNNLLYLAKRDRKKMRSVYHKEMVKRSMLLKIAAAWVITVPASGLLAAILYFAIRGFMLP